MEPIEFPEEIDFRKYWLVLRRRWLPIIVVFGAIMTLAFLYASRKENMYKASGKLLFKEDRSSSLTGLEALDDLTQIEGLSKKTEPLSTEAEIVNSRPIAEKAIKELNLTNEEGELRKPSFIASGMKVEPLPGTDVMQITYKSKDPKLAAKIVNAIMEAYIENDVSSNRAQAVAARKFLEKQQPKAEARVSQAEVALRRFKEENRVVSLSDEAKTAVETIAQLDKEIAQAQAELARIETKALELEDKVNLTPEEAIAVTSLSESDVVKNLLKEYVLVQGELAEVRSRYRPGHPRADQVERQARALRVQLDDTISSVSGDDLSLSTLESTQSGVPVSLEKVQLGQIEQKLFGEFVQTEVERLSLANKINTYINTRNSYKDRISNVPRLEQRQGELERRLEVARSTYSSLLSRLQEAQVAENQNVGNARIISPAEIPKSPIPSKEKLILLAGSVAGLLSGIAAAFLLDLVDSSVKNVKEAKELLGYTLLGIIPQYAKSRKKHKFLKEEEELFPLIYVRDRPHSPISSAYQMLQANLKFLSSDKQLKAIAVTSSIPKEGKSEVSANLAVAIAQVGRRVLLVDADMRDPTQHRLWEKTNAVGLSNVLVGEAELEVAIENVMPNLDLLTAGVIPPNPVALLDSKRMAFLIESFLGNYDSIIFDTPPLVGVADAPILGKMADGILMVVRPKTLNVSGAKAAKEFLIQSGQNVLGLVANGVIIKNEPDSYFYYTKEQYGAQAYAKQREEGLSLSSISMLPRSKGKK